MTPAIVAILNTPMPQPGGMFEIPDGSMFKNLGEYYLVRQLLNTANQVLNVASGAQRPGFVGNEVWPEGLKALYTLEQYKPTGDAAMAQMRSRGMSIS
jgi:hypothetical protein